jgi:hypothetical protein
VCVSTAVCTDDRAAASAKSAGRGRGRGGKARGRREHQPSHSVRDTDKAGSNQASDAQEQTCSQTEFELAEGGDQGFDSDSCVDTEDDEAYLHAISRSLDASSRVLGRGTRLAGRKRRAEEAQCPQHKRTRSSSPASAHDAPASALLGPQLLVPKQIASEECGGVQKNVSEDHAKRDTNVDDAPVMCGMDHRPLENATACHYQEAQSLLEVQVRGAAKGMPAEAIITPAAGEHRIEAIIPPDASSVSLASFRDARVRRLAGAPQPAVSPGSLQNSPRCLSQLTAVNPLLHIKAPAHIRLHTLACPRDTPSLREKAPVPGEVQIANAISRPSRSTVLLVSSSMTECPSRDPDLITPQSSALVSKSCSSSMSLFRALRLARMTSSDSGGSVCVGADVVTFTSGTTSCAGQNMKVESRRIPLTAEEMAVVQGHLTDKVNRVVIDMYNIEMSTSHIQCLKNLVWLNDEVINFYMELLKVCALDSDLVECTLAQLRPCIAIGSGQG